MAKLDLGNFYSYRKEIFNAIETDLAGTVTTNNPITKLISDEDDHIEVYKSYYCTSEDTVSRFINVVNNYASCEMVTKDKSVYCFDDYEYGNVKLYIFIVKSDSKYTIKLNIDWYPSYTDVYNIEKSGCCNGNQLLQSALMTLKNSIEKESYGNIKCFKIKGGKIKWKK